MSEIVVGEIVEETEPVKCSQVLGNRMQCPRIAVVGRMDDPENRYALCSVCYTMAGQPSGYNKEIK